MSLNQTFKEIETYQQIKKNINNGEYSLGFTATELDLAIGLGSNRKTTRAALVRLESEGYIKMTHYKGMVVVNSAGWSEMRKPRAINHLDTIKEVIIYSNASLADQQELLREILSLEKLLGVSRERFR